MNARNSSGDRGQLKELEVSFVWASVFWVVVCPGLGNARAGPPDRLPDRRWRRRASLICLLIKVNPNCDGPLASGVYYFQSASLVNGLGPTRDHNPGIDSPAGCWENSNYYTTWSVAKRN
jgi:hypothetical protein